MTLSQSEQALERRLGYRFSDRSLLTQALTHRSAGRLHNERLEFLGDAVLGFSVAALLFEYHPDANEGELSRMRAALVNREVLSALARELALGPMLRLGAGERKSGGSKRDSILCDAFEAVVGAVYIDGGIEGTQELIRTVFDERLRNVRLKDAKTQLQEIMQSRAQPLPHYEVLEIEGEEHDQTFVVKCKVVLLQDAPVGRGKTRRQAEQEAAGLALARLGQT